MWGTLGYVYNPKYVSREDAEDWGLLLNQKYYKKITAKDSVRDCYFAVRGMQTQKEILTKKFQNQSNYKERLSSLLNDTSDQSIQNAGMILSKIKDNVYSFETDSGKADLVSGKVVANLQWSGDGVYSMQQVEEEGIKLRYAVPKASTNLWFDGWCMLKSGIGKDKEKQQAAQAFVNYISRPDNVVRNMYYVGYTSVTVSYTHLIELKHIKKCYTKDVPVIYDFNLTINEGEFVTFLGPSGCGKTTILRMLAGFETPTSGEILFNGKDISELPPNERKFNTVFQKYALFPHLNIYDNISFGLKEKKVPKNEIKKKVKRVLEIVDLEGFEKRKIDSLSGGQQQRIAIARAIVNEPRILLLDEPLSALDYKMRQEMQIELKNMHKELGITFIFVTHDQEEALMMSDKIVVMSKGQIQQVGTPEAVSYTHLPTDNGSTHDRTISKDSTTHNRCNTAADTDKS